MADKLIAVAGDFWNVRGAFKLGGVVDIGTQTSLVRLANGRFVFLDAYKLSRRLRDAVATIVGDDSQIEAIINLHPFHTVHVAAMAEQYPGARLYGTARHRERFPDLDWESVGSEDAGLHALYGDDIEFTIPAGVDFISQDEKVHFSSVMALHRASGTIHVDDTLMYVRFPRLLGLLGLSDSLSFHPTLSMALEKREGAAAEFRDWAQGLIEDWGDAENLCAAHTALLTGERNRGAPIGERIERALARCEPRLAAHEKRYG